MADRGRINTRAFIPVAHSNGIIDITSKLASSLYLLSEEEDDDEDTLTWSNRTTPTQLPASHNWSDVTLTGSYASWEDDEEGVLDRVASEQVGLMFDAIDQSLYEAQDTGFQQMDKECVIWRESFPHMRIKGQHLLDSLEDGTEIVDPIVPSTPRATMTTTTSASSGTDLGITGHSMRLCSPPPIRGGDGPTDSLSPPGLHYEEILASEGEVEEYFAYNYSSSDRDMVNIKRSTTYSHHRNTHKIPPVSPSACLRDTVTALLFDQIWTEVAGVLHPLIKSSSQTSSLSREDCHLLPSQGLVPIHEFFLPKNSIQPSRGQQAGLQMMKHRPLVPPAQLPSSGVSFPQSHSTDLPSLRNVMTIKPVALQQRIPSSTLPPSLSVNNTVFQPPVVDMSDSNHGFHDLSKILPSNSRHVSFIHTPVPPRLSEPKLTSGKIGNKRNPLKPLEVPRTPGIPLIEDDLKEFGGLRGQRLVRHTQLPPLDPTQFDMTSKSPHGFRNYGPSTSNTKGQQHVAFSQRIVSAMTDTRGDSGGLNNKKNLYFGGTGTGMELRPNTSQTFHRSETPLTRRGSNNSVGVLLPPASSSPIKVIGYAANLHGDPVLWEEHEEEMR